MTNTKCTCGKAPKPSVEKAFNGVWLTLADGREFIHEKAHITRIGMRQDPNGVCYIHLGVNGGQPKRLRAGKKRATRKCLETLIALKYGKFSAMPCYQKPVFCTGPNAFKLPEKYTKQLYDDSYAGVPIIIERIVMCDSRIGHIPHCAAYDLIYRGRVLDSASAINANAQADLRTRHREIEAHLFVQKSTLALIAD